MIYAVAPDNLWPYDITQQRFLVSYIIGVGSLLHSGINGHVDQENVFDDPKETNFWHDFLSDFIFKYLL